MESSLEIKIVVPLVPVYRPEQHIADYVKEAIDELLAIDKKLNANREGCTKK